MTDRGLIRAYLNALKYGCWLLVMEYADQLEHRGYEVYTSELRERL